MEKPNSDSSSCEYGVGDCSFRFAGGEDGIKNLVDEFYNQMDTVPEAKLIRDMHPKDLTISKDKLTRFLCGWLGGPKLFHEKYGSIKLPVVHRRFEIGAIEKDAWLLCMKKAADKQNYDADFIVYLMKQLAIPAGRIQNKN